MAGKAEKLLMDVVNKMPLTWKCLSCGRETPNHPGAELPAAVKTGLDEHGRWAVLGDICSKCMAKD